MELLTASMLEALTTEKKRQFEELLPYIIKKLIISGTSDLTGLRIPAGNDIWASGFDGVITCVKGTTYIAEGTSVWEFGTSEDSIRKIDSDYLKRTEDSLGIDKSLATFYLVTPKIWAFKKTISQWEAEHTDWKAVRVYDASVLCDWINSEPTVISWLLEVLFKKTVDFSEINQAWRLFSQKTTPPFSLEMFLENRENEMEILNKSLERPVIKVKSDSFIDAIGFVLGTLKQNRDLQEKCVVVNNETTYKSISTFTKNKIIILNYASSHDIVPSENSVIVCYNKEAISIKPDVQLPLYSKMHYYNAFRKMGMNESEAHELYAFCHGNLRALVRRIPGIANEYMPEWVGIAEKKLLEPIIYLRAIDTNYDREIVEKIANTSFETVEEFYKLLVQKEDSPIKRIENNYLIVNYEEAWSVLGYSVNDSAFDRFHQSVKWFLEEIQKDGLYTGRFGQSHMLKQHVRHLLLNYVYYSFSSDDSRKITDVVTELLPYASVEPTASLLIENMAVLAEAAPVATLDFIENNLKEESNIFSLFNTSDYRNEYTGILSALDELTLHQRSSIKACKLLFSLYQLDNEYKILNSPEESLLTALCLFNTDVALSIQQKRELIVYFNKIDPPHTCELICKLLGKDSFWKSVRYGEHHYDVQNELTIQEIMDTSEFIAGLAFDYLVSCGDISALQLLLKQYHHLRPTYLKDLVHRFSGHTFSDKDLIPVVFQLKDRVYSIQKYQIEAEFPYLTILQDWESLLLSICSEEERDDWLFYKTYDCPSESLLEYKDDYYEREQQTKKLRVEKLKGVLQSRGISGVNRLLKRMENHSYWGAVLAATISEDSLLFTLVEAMIADEKYAIIGGLIDAASEDCAKAIYSSLSNDLRFLILPFVYRRDFWKILETEEEKKEYWKQKDMLSLDEEYYEQLLIYNPRGLVMYIYDRMKKEPVVTIEQAKKTINALLSNEMDLNPRAQHDEYYITEILKIIDSLSYSDEWAKTTIELYNKGLIQKMPLSGKVFFFHNPYKFVEFVSHDPSRRFSEQWKFSLPANACDEYDALVFFVKTLIESDNMSLAGSIIGKIPGDEDGVRLNERIRELLEYVDDTEFDNAVISGIINTIGLRTVTDGTDRKALSVKYEKDALSMELFYPHAAYVLHTLSRFYLSEGKQDYIQSEIYDY